VLVEEPSWMTRGSSGSAPSSIGVNALATISSEALPCTIGLASPRPLTPSSVKMRTHALRLRPPPQST
jgi:hypothetical protein